MNKVRRKRLQNLELSMYRLNLIGIRPFQSNNWYSKFIDYWEWHQ